jgi:hypothetical protein
MSYLVNYSKWRSIFEAEDASLSNVTYKLAFTGATPSVAPNKDALAEFKSANPGIAFADEATLDDTRAIARIKLADGKFQYKVTAKTVNAKDYLKIGALILNGDKNTAVSITITKQDLMNGWEASGNGIFALGRALKLSTNLENTDKIIVGLNNPNPNGFIANAKTGVENSLEDWKTSIEFTFILSKAVIPSASNKSSNTVTAVKISNQPDSLDQAKTYFNRNSVPNVPTADKEELKKVSLIDTTAFVDKIKGKSAKSYDANTAALVKEFADKYTETYLNTYAERFKKYLNTKATGAGIDPKLFAGLVAYIDKWKTDELAKKADYLAAAEQSIKDQFSTVSPGATKTGSQTNASGQVVTGKEGEL